FLRDLNSQFVTESSLPPATSELPLGEKSISTPPSLWSVQESTAFPVASPARFVSRRTSVPPKPVVRHPISAAGTALRRRQELPSHCGTSIVRLPCSEAVPKAVFSIEHGDGKDAIPHRSYR